jgi:thermostable 8-oxoguanine DNA glycosylase
MHSSKHQSMQQVLSYRDGELIELTLPAPTTRIFGHQLRWGRAEEIGTPAYWTAQAWMWETEDPEHYRLGRTLREEMLACLLGGYGIPAEVGLAAYDRLRAAPADALEDEHSVLKMLTTPLEVKGRPVRYRFARQKARHVALCVTGLADIDTDVGDRDLRDALVGLSGIGPKTASWIVRNWRDSDQVSILDIHIIRACHSLGLFDAAWRVERHYAQMEAAYLAFAEAIGARASILDSVIWMTMRQLPQDIVAKLTIKDVRIQKNKTSKAVDIRQAVLI